MAAASRRIVFLCSGGGGNLRFVQKAIALGWIPGAHIASVFTDRPCAANDFAAAAGLPQEVIDFRSADQQAVADALDAARPDLVITTVHRILHAAVVDRFRGRLLNVHYSLLPAFGGMIGVRPVEAALAFGARFAGVTAHEVDETVDGGKPVVQAVFPVQPGEAAASLMNLVFRCGCLALMAAGNTILHGRPAFPGESLQLLDRTCWFSAALGQSPAALNDERVWAEIAAAPPGAPAP